MWLNIRSRSKNNRHQHKLQEKNCISQRDRKTEDECGSVCRCAHQTSIEKGKLFSSIKQKGKMLQHLTHFSAETSQPLLTFSHVTSLRNSKSSFVQSYLSDLRSIRFWMKIRMNESSLERGEVSPYSLNLQLTFRRYAQVGVAGPPVDPRRHLILSQRARNIFRWTCRLAADRLGPGVRL